MTAALCYFDFAGDRSLTGEPGNRAQLRHGCCHDTLVAPWKGRIRWCLLYWPGLAVAQGHCSRLMAPWLVQVSPQSHSRRVAIRPKQSLLPARLVSPATLRAGIAVDCACW